MKQHVEKQWILLVKNYLKRIKFRNNLQIQFHFKYQIYTIIKAFKNKLFKIPDNCPTEYELAAGFDIHTRIGSRSFNQYFGKMIEHILAISPYINKRDVLFDNDDNDSCIEVKSKFNTMKGSQAVTEITSKLEKAHLEDKHFLLFIMVDQNNKNRFIPLHRGHSLKGIENVITYNNKYDKWISGDLVIW